MVFVVLILRKRNRQKDGCSSEKPPGRSGDSVCYAEPEEKHSAPLEKDNVPDNPRYENCKPPSDITLQTGTSVNTSSRKAPLALPKPGAHNDPDELPEAADYDMPQDTSQGQVTGNEYTTRWQVDHGSYETSCRYEVAKPLPQGEGYMPLRRP